MTMLDEHMVDAARRRRRRRATARWRASCAARRATPTRSIFKEARENLARAGMGTTMTAVQLWRDSALVAQVGDRARTCGGRARSRR